MSNTEAPHGKSGGEGSLWTTPAPSAGAASVVKVDQSVSATVRTCRRCRQKPRDSIQRKSVGRRASRDSRQVTVHLAAPLTLAEFGAGDDPLSSLQHFPQGQYLKWYLADLGATTVLIRTQLFRSGLPEAALGLLLHEQRRVQERLPAEPTFRSRSTERSLSVPSLTMMRRGRRLEAPTWASLSAGRYLERLSGGRFARLSRATHGAPAGDQPCPRLPLQRCGPRLEVEGLAWQQQDQGVGACATIALWTMLH